MSIDLNPEHLATVRKILAPIGVPVYVFGSRVKGKSKRFSDLDLLIKESIDRTLLRKIRSEFEESNLPFKVELLVWSELDEAFQRQIESDVRLFFF